jgi:hypothetical protein
MIEGHPAKGRAGPKLAEDAMLRIFAMSCALALVTTVPTKDAQASTSYADPVKRVEATAKVELALNPQPEPPNKNRKPQKIKKGDPGKNK